MMMKTNDILRKVVDSSLAVGVRYGNCDMILLVL